MPPGHNNIIARLKKDDLKTLRYLFDQYYKDLVRLSMKFVMNKVIAEEIVQDVFIRIWNNRNNIIIGKSFEAYLFTSVKNGSINYVRSKYARIRFTTLDDSAWLPVYETAEDDIITGELKKTIRRAIHSLPQKCKIIFNLSRNAGLSDREIAEQLNISVKTVQTQIGIAIRKIKKHLEDQWNNIPS
jgi:RNA polymerase sigma-70 factor (ECF subfamily)